ncbi:MAG: type II/IV secretion system ATPase subunit [Gemmatimonadetes bacterium]|nr:type II/IV secretion system ATPase subunit [Gemmatimonadota bacterium]
MANFPHPYTARSIERHDEVAPLDSALYKSLPPELQEAAGRDIHLLKYLLRFPVDELGMPTYRPKLDRSDGDSESPNLIYPVGNSLYVHVLADPEKGRDYYISIEPAIEHPQLADIISDVEERLLDFTEELRHAQDEDTLRRVLSHSLDVIFGRKVGRLELGLGKDAPREEGEEEAGDGGGAVTKTERKAVQTVASGNGGSSSLFLEPLARVFGRGKGGGPADLARKWGLDDIGVDGIKYSLLREKVGLGTLDPLIHDGYIEDISCSGVGRIFVEHKIFKSLRTSFGYATHKELDDFIVRLSERVKKPVTFRQPVVDATLPDGSRINMVYGQDVSTRGSNYTIRKFSDEPLSIIQLAKWGSLNWEMAAYMSLVIEDGLNVFVSGETASGKTTLMNALTTFVEPNAKIVSIEDTAEVNVPHKNWIREVTRKPKPGEEDEGVGMFELLKAALRQRPDEIIIGEIRGEEGNIAFQAMQTGHAVMATFHAASIQKLIQRITGVPISVPKNYVDNLNCVIIQSAVRLPSGKKGRRAVSVNEIVAYDSQSDSFSFVEVFRWDPVTDRFQFLGLNNSYLLEQKIALMRGYPPSRRRQIYNLVKRRARILEKLADSGLNNYYDVYGVISKAIREGVF